jgi:hypothetical protein
MFLEMWHLFLVDQPIEKERMHISLDPDPALAFACEICWWKEGPGAWDEGCR